MSGRYTYIVVGAGSAGCVLANRLSEEPGNRVLLLEAGDRDWSPLVTVPLGSGKMVRSGTHGWGYSSEPIETAAGRRINLPRGKLLGGSSSINGLVYIRGNRWDYDQWAARGNRGWSYAELLPYFKRSEGHESRSGPYHGTGGPLTVRRAASPSPLYPAFIEAGQQAGFPSTDDFNGPQQEGFGRFDFNIRKGRRCSAAVAFLRPARHRPNLDVRTSAHATRLLFEGGRVTGVEYLSGGSLRIAEADAEVIVAAGSFNSPQLLMLSGIGDPVHLKERGVEPRIALKGVGNNLQDHVHVGLRFACPQPVTLHQLIRVDRVAIAMARALLFGSGPAARFPVEGAAFTRKRPDSPVPDIQWHFLESLGVSRVRIPGRNLLSARDPFDRDGFTMSVCVLRPESRGKVLLRSNDPHAKPMIHANYLSAPADLETLFIGVGQVRRVAQQPALAPFISEELSPGPGVKDKNEIEAWIRASIESVHHQVGTCRMGPDSDPDAVVDDQLRVRGVTGLRVADASIMPTLTGANTHATAVAIGEKAADLVLGRPAPAPEDPDLEGRS